MYVEDPPNEIMYCFGIHQSLFEEMEKTSQTSRFTKDYPHRRSSTNSRQTDATPDRVGRCDAPSRTERGHGIVIYPGMSPPQTERRVHYTEHVPQWNEIENHRIKHNMMMKNVRDVSQVASLGRQLFPGRSKILTSAFADATSLPFEYLVVDMSPHSEDTYRLRTCVFPGEDPIVYVPKHL